MTEIMSETQIDDFEEVDIVQVGARNMQNFRLLKALGQTKKPVLLKQMCIRDSERECRHE